MSASKIREGLWVGGKEAVIPWREKCPGGLVIACAKVDDAHEYFVFEDDWLGGMSIEEQRTAVAAARRVNGLLAATRACLVVCREGRNRSCLVAVMALQLGGLKSDEAVELVKRARDPALTGEALTNRYFREFIASDWVRAFVR